MAAGVSFLELTEKEAFHHAEEVENGESCNESSRSDNSIPTRSHHAIARTFGGRMRRVFLLAVPICLAGAAVIIGVAQHRQITESQEGNNMLATTKLLGKKGCLQLFKWLKRPKKKDVEEGDGAESSENLAPEQDKFTFKVETNDLFQESLKWRSLESGTFLPLPADEFVRTLEQQRVWPEPDTPLGRRSPPIEDMWKPSIGMLISPKKYSFPVEATNLALIGGSHQGLFFAQPVLPVGAPRVVVKATRRTGLPRERVQIEMYKDASRCKLINSIGDNLLGYLGCTFPVQGTNGYFMVMEMEEKGFPIECLADDDYFGKHHCPKRDGECLWKPDSFDNEQIAAIILGAMRAVAGMKNAGFVSHGDVKPLNVLIPKNAMELSPEQLAKATRLIDHDSAITSITTLGPKYNIIFSKFYMPPEFYEETITLSLLSQVDVWSCGMTLLDLVLGCGDPSDAREYAGKEEFSAHPEELKWISENFIHNEIKEVLVGSERLKMLPLLQGMLAKQDKRWDIGTAMERLQSFIVRH